MGALGRLVVDPGVRGELAAAVASSPRGGRVDQRSPVPLAAVRLDDEPSFDEAHRASGVAPVGVGA
jgi:hypothetical protein